MDNPTYVSLSRQTGLMKEMTAIANNIANANTTGFKREGAVFTEFVKAAAGNGTIGSDPQHSLSMGRLGAHVSHFESGGLQKTGGTLDLAIDGEGFFRIETPNGERLTRAGHFMTNAEGTMIMPNGYPVLDDGGGQIQIPQEVNILAIGGDGTISADGIEIGRLGVVGADPTTLTRQGDNLWQATQGTNEIEFPQLVQGFVESSNVEPVNEIARMIEVQRHYDAGQKLLDLENDRIKGVLTTLRQLA